VNVHAGRFPLFDPLRAIAAVSVLLYHVAFFEFVHSSNALRPYTAHLDVGVNVFFLISGFLLYRPFVRARLFDAESPHVPGYAWRRFLRIVPAYWVALTVVALWLGLDEVFTRKELVTYYGFLQIYHSNTSLGGIGQAWTLCVEVTFYAFLPVWALLIRRVVRGGVRRELVALGVLFLASFGYKVWALDQISPNNLFSGPYLQPLPNFLDQFAVGMALAVGSVELERMDRLPRAVDWLRRHDWVPWVLAAVAFWALSTRIGYTGKPFEGATRRKFLELHELKTVVAFGLIVPAIVAVPGRGVAGRVLATRVLAYLGLISYGIYLYHFAVVKQLGDWISFPGPAAPRFLLHALLALAGATVLATLSYYLVERPALRLKRLVRAPVPVERGEATAEPEAAINPSSATPASTTSATSAGWRKRGTP
jgi:peptidoglycan/LPS O-acetylase OafA/YrhL